MCSVQFIPSGDVAHIVELLAVMQNKPSSEDHVTPYQSRDVDDIVCSDHVIPSGDVAQIVEL